ncbi:MAG: hypothetical protein ACXVIG_03610 [Halobacteriota archaeon]
MPGVRHISIGKRARFQRWGQVPRGELKQGRIEVSRLEIVRLDNDPNVPKNGTIGFYMTA